MAPQSQCLHDGPVGKRFIPVSPISCFAYNFPVSPLPVTHIPVSPLPVTHIPVSPLPVTHIPVSPISCFAYFPMQPPCKK
jgi:chitinase